MPLEMRGLGTGPASATVSCFSRFGCRVQCRRPYHPGARINLTQPGLAAIDAHVVWYRKRGMGLEFDHPLHQAVADHLIRCYPAAPSTE